MRKTEIQPNPRALPATGTIYFVGIGGAGMSALAQVLAEQGRAVAGADPGIAPRVRERLENAGAIVFTDHAALHLGEDAAVVIVSDAVPASNPEVAAARERGLPILRRPELLGLLLNQKRGIAIAGTHGKTTTTGMVSQILLAAHADPTIFLGGDLPAIAGNARSGRSDIVLAEACEAYDGFLYMRPEIAVVLNVEADHLDYHGTEAAVIASFEQFIGQIKPGGTAVVCADDDKALALLHAGHDGLAVLTYGIDGEDADVVAEHLSIDRNPTFTLARWDEPLGRVTLRVPGEHNVRNALAAASVGLALGIAPGTIIAGLEAFTGTGRRFETIGETHGVRIIDDYAHHPTEIRATLAAARAAYPNQRIIAVFQPHLPSRTRDQMAEFADALAAADVVFLTDIYLAREQPIDGVSSAILAQRIPAKSVVYIPEKNDLPERLAATVRPGDLVLTLGAGDIRAAATGLLEKLS